MSEIAWYRGMRVRRPLRNVGYTYGTLTHCDVPAGNWLVVGDRDFDIFSDRELGELLDLSSGRRGDPGGAGWEPDPEAPVATLTAERDEARTEASHLRSRCAAYEAALGQDHADTVSDLAMLSAARDADRAMLGRIIGCEQSDASMVVLLERAEAVIAGLRAEIAAVTDPDGFPLRDEA